MKKLLFTILFLSTILPCNLNHAMMTVPQQFLDAVTFSVTYDEIPTTIFIDNQYTGDSHNAVQGYMNIEGASYQINTERPYAVNRRYTVMQNNPLDKNPNNQISQKNSDGKKINEKVKSITQEQWENGIYILIMLISGDEMIYDSHQVNNSNQGDVYIALYDHNLKYITSGNITGNNSANGYWSNMPINYTFNNMAICLTNTSTKNTGTWFVAPYRTPFFIKVNQNKPINPTITAPKSIPFDSKKLNNPTSKTKKNRNTIQTATPVANTQQKNNSSGFFNFN